MATLTQAQRSVLSSACNDQLGLATRPAKLKPAQVSRMTVFFAENRLAKEIRAKADHPVWREDAEGRCSALKILKAGRALIDASVVAGAGDVDNRGAVAPSEQRCAESAASSLVQIAGPKSQLVISLMNRLDGATIDDMIAATGWLPHTARAALSGLRKKGVAIERQPAGQGRASVYRIAAGAVRQAA